MHPYTAVFSYLSFASSAFGLEPLYETVNVNVSQPRDNAPLNKTLAYYRLNGTGADGQPELLQHSFVPVGCGAMMSVHHNLGCFEDAGSDETPILILNHGYPESSYIWRKLTAELSKRVPLVVPDRPGYGLSTACLNGSDERSTASAIIDSTVAIFGEGKSVVLAGHDRGARAVQRAAVDIGQGLFPQIVAKGAFLADVVPIVAEYASFPNPNNTVGYFHWSLLPRLQEGFSINLIMAYGGGNFVDFLNNAGKGINETAIKDFVDDDAFAVYHNFYNQLSITNASAWDYYSAATVDFLEMEADQKAGRRIKMPTHVEYSHYNLVELSGFDVAGIWANYTDPSAGLTTEAVCCGQGHFIVELAPWETIGQINAFLDRLGVKAARF